MNDPVKLVTTKPDAEVAAELKAELAEAAKPYLEAITKAHRMGFMLNAQMAINPFGHAVFTQLQLSKMF